MQRSGHEGVLGVDPERACALDRAPRELRADARDPRQGPVERPVDHGEPLAAERREVERVGEPRVHAGDRGDPLVVGHAHADGAAHREAEHERSLRVDRVQRCESVRLAQVEPLPRLDAVPHLREAKLRQTGCQSADEPLHRRAPRAGNEVSRAAVDADHGERARTGHPDFPPGRKRADVAVHGRARYGRVARSRRPATLGRMVRVRFAPSPTGSLHVGNALVAAANRRVADEHDGALVLRIDDTDPARNVPGGEEEILRDLAWLGIGFDEGPIRQSERQERYREAAGRLGERFDGITLLRQDRTATYQLASVVDDVELGITHVIRGSDHRPNEALHRRLHEALGVTAPEYVYVGLILRPEGGKLSKRDPLASLADLRDAGIPGEAVRAYLDELGLPRHDVRYDPARIRRLGVTAIAELSDVELAARVGAPVEVVPALRGARTLDEARAAAESVLQPLLAELPEGAAPTLHRLAELRAGAASRLDKAAARELVRELKAVGGDLRAVRLALTGRGSGPELWAVLAALDRDETLRRLADAGSPERAALR